MPVSLLKRGASQDELTSLQQQLCAEVDACTEVYATSRNVLKRFLIKMEVWHISEMDYPLRCAYNEYLKMHEPDKPKGSLLCAFDKVKQHSIQELKKTLHGMQEIEWKYKNKIFFIPYHPEEAVVKKYDKMKSKQRLAWDFTKVCSGKWKNQIFTILNMVIHMNERLVLRRERLDGLHYLYEYGIKSGIDDLELLEQNQIIGFKEYVKENVSSKYAQGRMIPIIDFCRKVLFLSSDKIHWHANVWYLERMHFDESRINPSDVVVRISFLDVTQPDNRRILKEYMRYALGVTEESISRIESKYQALLNFLLELNQSNTVVTDCTAECIDGYIGKLQNQPILEKTFNSKIMAITHFYNFLMIRGYITKVPFYADYYLKKVIPVHNDRSVDDEISMNILRKLRYFPEELRLMFLHLWCLGLRISEVCTLKGNAYYRQGQDAWIQIYQIKMKTYKRIPIPEALYKLMQVYIKRHKRQPDDYIFQNSTGGAFLYNTFREHMKFYCKENGIEDEDYIFKSHDYRHTVATIFYDNGVSIQSIRDYLGHIHEEMTEQYIDYIPLKIAKANDEYFSQKTNSLAIGLKKGGKKNNAN